MTTEFVEDNKNHEITTVISDPLSKKLTDDSLDAEVSDYISKFLDMSNEARENDHKDKNMSLGEGLKTFPKAAMWSVILSTALIMEGYDTNLLNSFYGFPAFAEKFGQWYEDAGEYQIPAKWQTSLSMAVNVGEILGLYMAGIIADRYGYRHTLIGALFFTICFIFIVFFAQNLPTLLVGEILLGLPWGFFQTITLSYASEVCPQVLRLYLTTYVNCCWVIGQLISSGVLRAFVNSSSKDAYRIPFAVQWVWPIPIMIGIYLAPESPWWLVKKGRLAEAKKSVKRLLSENSHLPNKELLAEAMLTKMQLTVKEEEATQAGTSYYDCVKGVDFRRTRVAAMTWLIQNITGSALMGYSTYFYIQAGLSVNMSFTFSIIQYCLGLIGTLVSWFASQKLGRFTLFFSGLCTMFAILITVGGLGFAHSNGASWAIGSLLLIFTFVYNITVGPICYCLVAELPSTRLRTKTIIIARNIYNLAGIVIAIISPYMLNPTAWNWKAKTGLFWAGFAFFSLIYCWFELPETKGMTFAHLDQLFQNKVSARKFKSTEVEVFDAGHMLEKLGDEGVKHLVADHLENVKEKDQEA